ncbi:hypothetical protein A0O34_05935 [Chryseobacterium glaciei]|uniref:4Fe4S-binding SPASM domain-containing protein n=1 Tax=Chryseobacterium glaciei TaxID=1685010 RepID=A0A172XST4_9FLAO|nr:grasp-with-spasm system SPASM domain peptide maturase [Chryseobacterium glaciei]ANF50077.1 hypothetical protein A0O34_05935 [Chryseobacterium glaciei]
MKTTKYFHLYQDCIIVKGILNSLLIDHYKGKIFNIPTVIVTNQILKNRFIHNTESNCELISALSEDDFGYFTDDIDTIEKQIVWNSPRNINEIIIEHTLKDFYNLDEIYSKIENIDAEFIQIRFLEYSKEKLDKILTLLENSCIRTIEILIPYIDKTNTEEITKELSRNHRIQIVYFYNAPYTKSMQYENLFTVLFYEKNLTSGRHCGIVDEDYFITDIKNISKSILHNSCLKDKLFISQDGSIKNCPSMPQSFGNIKNITLEKAINHTNFKKYWNLTKDNIEVCKDCEFRYICTDCRAYTELTHNNEEGLDISKPLKCGYDPHIGEWTEWSTNSLKQKAIKHYEMDKII